MLEIKNLTKTFGGLTAIKEFDAEIGKREIVGLIGPNGAGKTTLFNVITGFYAPDMGTITFNDKGIGSLKPHNICRLGISRTFQIPQLFWNLSALRNVEAGVFFGRNKSAETKDLKKEAPYWLEFCGLLEKKDVSAGKLNLNEKKKLEVARALSTQPEIILLDEPMAGLTPSELESGIELIRRIKHEYGISIFWIEHVMKAVMEASERIIVLELGSKIADGTPLEVSNNKRVIDAYLGEDQC